MESAERKVDEWEWVREWMREPGGRAVVELKAIGVVAVAVAAEVDDGEREKK